jgi:hypothetical protein
VVVPVTNGVAGSGRNTQIIRGFKASGCVVCGVRYPDVGWDDLHWHHRDRGTKEKPSSWFYYGATVDELLLELVKCEVLCTKCHHRTYGRKDTSLQSQPSLFQGTGSWVYA